ncbi:MAG: rRNA adenine N-6-methyltransferase family protein [Leptospiraceae bacterium]|nr:rRNA adenine N-6-methyltransferase family protein [Leptospiraceae bacterium]
MPHPAQELKRLGIRPRKSWGQNFLVDMSPIWGSEHLFLKDKVILEIGPGLGMITQYFSQLGFSMILVEKDKILAHDLQQRFPQHEVICADFLDLDSDFFKKKGVCQIISNLPFYITTPILEKVVLFLPEVERALFGMQKEVAQRIVKEKGSSLALFMKAFGESQIFRHISRRAFYPEPEVDVSFLFWRRQEKIAQKREFELLLRALFWGRRKKIATSLLRSPHLAQAKLSFHIRRRLEELKKKEIANLMERRSDSLSFSEVQTLFCFLFDDPAS